MAAEGRQPGQEEQQQQPSQGSTDPPEGGAGGQLKRVAAGMAQQLALQLWKLS